MKTNPIFLRAIFIAASLLGAGCLTASGEDAPDTSTQGEAAKPAKPAKPAIQKGMSAEEVRKIIGEPAAIKHIDKEDITAETWTYRRKVRTETTQEVVGDVNQPAFVGLGMGDESGLGTASVPVYRLKHTTFYQVTALLMVDGTLVEARQWVDQEVNYEG
ncbi:MAG TPA: hypothetical protein VIK52_05760 [Opitutaceae bacterium]